MKYLSTILLILVSLAVKAQIPTLDQLIAFRTKSIADLEETLVIKNWKMVDAQEATDTTRSSVTFGLGMNNYDDKARMFLILLTEDSQPNRLSVQINRLADYQTYLSRLKTVGFKYVNSSIVNGGLKKVYYSKTNAIVIKSQPDEDSEFGTSPKTIYFMSIYNLNDYKNNL